MPTSTHLFLVSCWYVFVSSIEWLIVVQTVFCYDFLADVGAHELSRVVFPLFCLSCGFFPLKMYLDGNRKSNFAIRGINLGAFACVCYCKWMNMLCVCRRACRNDGENREYGRLSSGTATRLDHSRTVRHPTTNHERQRFGANHGRFNASFAM